MKKCCANCKFSFTGVMPVKNWYCWDQNDGDKAPIVKPDFVCDRFYPKNIIPNYVKEWDKKLHHG